MNDLDARLRFIVGCTLAACLSFTMLIVLGSLVFVDQPAEQTPNDAQFFELITPIATFLVGSLSGIMMNGRKTQE